MLCSSRLVLVFILVLFQEASEHAHWASRHTVTLHDRQEASDRQMCIEVQESLHLLLLLLLQFPVSTTWVMTIRRANEFQKHDAFPNITHSSINNEAKHKKTITARNMSACSKSASFRVGKHTLLVFACWIRWQQIFPSYCWYSELQVCADSKNASKRGS